MVDMVVIRWSPDVCECILHYEIDRDLPSDQRTSKFHHLERKCAKHRTISDDSVVFDTVLSESRRRDYVMGHPFHVIVQSDLTTIDAYIQDKIRWQYLGEGTQRVLHIQFGDAVTAEMKQETQEWADRTYGAGKVEVA